MKIIIDCHALAHRARYAMRDSELSTGNMKTDVIFGFLYALNSLANVLGSSEFIFAWDSRKNFRTDIYPTYKQKRFKEKTPEEKEFDDLTLPQFQKIRMHVLNSMGFMNNIIQTGFEADDIMAALTKGHPDTEFIIVSNDNDLYQLLTPNVKMYDPRGRKFITEQWVFDKWGIEASRWAEVKALAGCKADTVGGISGVAEKTAIKYLDRRLSRKTDAYKTIEDSEEIIKRNRNLVELPFKGTLCPTLLPDQITFAKFVEVFHEYEFNSFAKDIADWRRNFEI